MKLASFASEEIYADWAAITPGKNINTGVIEFV